MEKKILILILASNRYPSPLNEYMQKKTWIKKITDKNIEVIYFKSSKITSLKGRYLHIKQKNKTIFGIKERTVSALDWCIQNKDFDFILRMNSSSYINIENLRKFINNMNSEYIYAGREMLFHNDKFVSGAGIILNRKSVNLILENKNLLENNLFDDVAIGKLFKDKNIDIYPGDFQYFSKNIYKEDIQPEHYQYRCNSYYFGYPRFLEPIIMKKIDKTLNGISNTTTDYFLMIFINIMKFLNFNYFFLRYIKKSNRVHR